jgi:ribosomal protein S3AE
LWQQTEDLAQRSRYNLPLGQHTGGNEFPGIQQTLLRMVLPVTQHTPLDNFKESGQHALIRLTDGESSFTAFTSRNIAWDNTAIMVFRNTTNINENVPVTADAIG